MSDKQDLRNPTTQAREAIEIVCSGNLGRLADYYSPDFVDHVNDVVHLGHEGLYESFDLSMSSTSPSMSRSPRAIASPRDGSFMPPHAAGRSNCVG